MYLSLHLLYGQWNGWSLLPLNGFPLRRAALLGMFILDAFRLFRVAVFLLVSVHTYDS